MSYIVILMSFQTIYSINYDKMKVRWVFQLGFNLNRIHDSVGKALRTANQASSRDCQLRGVNYSEKNVRRFLGLENPGNFSRDSGIFSPKFKGFWDFFTELIFSKYFPLYFFSPNFFRNVLRHIIRRIIFKTK